ncbi:MAG: hypothetical protein B7Z72_10410, partial [Gemmatimonadetes bacterium 21-71-4]
HITNQLAQIIGLIERLSAKVESDHQRLMEYANISAVQDVAAKKPSSKPPTINILAFVKQEYAKNPNFFRKYITDEEEAVAIETLLYRGPDALTHALALQSQLDALLAAEGPGGPGVAPLFREVFDLIQLGLSARP